jgi:apolipoprotein N-acyltransferase
MALALPVTLVSIECLRGELVCSGYAWFFTAHPLVEWTTIAQVAAFGGGWMVTALAALVAGAAVDLWTRADRARILSPLVALTMLALAIGYGTARIAAVDARIARATDTPRLLVVQTNLPMSNKLDWPPDAQIEDFLAFARLTIDGARAAHSGGSDPDGASRLTAALWPETMLPGLGLEPESIKTLVDGGYYPGNRYEEAMRDLATRIDAPLLVGSPAYLGLRVEGNRFRWSEQFNSAYLVGADGVLGRTDKIYLTPFGETMPIISNSDWLEAQLLALGADGMTFDLEAAAQPQVLAVPARDGAAVVTIGVPICFEITQAWASRRIVFAEGKRVAGIAVNLSNDGWFGPSRAGRRQHLQVAQLRAIELDTPVVRCVNTGISASIDAAGRVLEGLAPETDGSFVATPTPSTGVPPSYWLTNATSFTALGLLALGLIRTRRDFEAVAAVPIG